MLKRLTERDIFIIGAVVIGLICGGFFWLNSVWYELEIKRGETEMKSCKSPQFANASMYSGRMHYFYYCNDGRIVRVLQPVLQNSKPK